MALTEEKIQPAAGTSPGRPAAAGASAPGRASGDIEAQLDSLLQEIEERPEAAQAVPVEEPTAAQGTALPVVEFGDGALPEVQGEAAAAAGGKPAASKPAAEENSAEVGDDLAKQIQELLDDANKATAASAAPMAIAPDALARAQAETAGAALGKRPSAPVDPEIRQVDAVLAQNAEEAVAGDFETVSDAVGAAASPAETSAGAVKFEAPAAEPPRVEGDEPELDGAFESPEQLLQETAAPGAAATVGGFSADAQAVARELDSQPENRAGGPTPAPIDATVPPTRRRLRLPRFSLNLVTLERWLVAINRVMPRLSPELRDGVGWAGVVTLFLAVMLLVARTCFGITGQGSPEAHAAASHAEAATHDAHAAPAPAKSKGHGDAHAPAKADAHAAKPKPKAAGAKPTKKPAKAEAHGGH